jgi:predicted amidophosphoribosyltransferase
MPMFTPREDPDQEHEQNLAGLQLDLEERVCPDCGRSLHPWEDHCPEDGAAAVPRYSQQTMPPPPAHLLDDDQE